MKKRLKIIIGALAIILVFGIVATIGVARHRKGYEQPPAQNMPRKSSLTLTSNGPQTLDVANAPMTKDDIEKVMKIDFQQCKNVKDKIDFDNCINAIEKAKVRISNIRDPILISNLIKLAKNKKFPSPKSYSSKNDLDKIIYKQKVCDLRYAAIEALGQIGDQKVINDLIDIMEEKYTNETGCFFQWSGDDRNSICEKASKVLIKMKPIGISNRLIKDLENGELAFQKSHNILFEGNMGDLDIHDINSVYANYYNEICYIDTLKYIGDGNKEYSLLKLKSTYLGDAQKVIYLKLLAGSILNNDEVGFVKTFIYDGNASIFKGAALDALVANPSPQFIRLYVDLIEDGFIDYGFMAIGKIHTPESLKYLDDTLNSNDKSKYWYAVKALCNYSSDDIIPIVPVLFNMIQKEPDNNIYYVPIAIANDPKNVIKLVNIINNCDNGNYMALATIGLIKSSESQEALQNIVSGNIININIFDNIKNYNSFRTRALYWLLYQVGERGEEYGKIYFNNEIVQVQMKLANELPKLNPKDMYNKGYYY